MELDHLFVVAQVGNPAAAKADLPLSSANIARNFARQLGTMGFSEGSSNRHSGQGTANYRFFFEGFMLEFLFVDDIEGLVDKRAKPLGMFNRFTNSHCSPVGVASRRRSADSSDASYAFSVYQPHYLPPHLHIQVAEQPTDNEPLWFHLPFVSGSNDVGKPVDSEPRQHANNASRLTSLIIEMPFQPLAASRDIGSQLNVEVRLGERHAVHMVFDEGHQGMQLPLSADMPMTIAI